MRQLVIVVSDLYFTEGDFATSAARPAAGARSSAALARLPGLTGLMRFGALEALPRGWRSWLAAWLGREDLASASPSAVAARAALGRGTPPSQWVWLADPLHLIAGLTSVHLSPQGRLRLDQPAQAELCRAFDAAFAETGYALAPTRSGRFLASGPPLPQDVETTDPARCLGSTIADALPRGRAAAPLRRLGAEIEMWLHEHPINVRRARAGRPPIGTLWLWGGGAPLAVEESVAAAGDRSPATAFFGDDPYVEGLSHLIGAACGPAAGSLASLAAAAADRRVVQLELFSASDDSRVGPRDEPRSPEDSPATPLHAIEALDRHWLEPALELLGRREIERLVVVANDRKVSIMRRDRLKRWRRPRGALAALAALQRAPGSEPGRARP